ncbi:MAG: PP2C family protein-serine/threonine phosphatase, partial [Candidatus Eiseniibacteriota bacterium]
MKVSTIDVAARSDRGKKRETNEDAYLVFRSGRFLKRIQSNISEEEMGSHYDEVGYVLAVADGMGGAAAGEQASRGALVEALQLILRSPKWLLSLDDPATRESDIQAFFDRMKLYFAGMHAALLRKAAEDPSVAGMGTTATVVYVLGGDLFVVHVGDSRAYLHRDGALRRITHDHTVAQSLADSGKIAQEEVDTHPRRHVLTQVVGGSGGWFRAEMHHLRLQSGDTVVVCTDGLTGTASDEEIAQVLTKARSSDAACDTLLA